VSEETGKGEEVMEHANVGHGHVYLRADGYLARCRGPRMCSECSKELSQVAHPTGGEKVSEKEPEKMARVERNERLGTWVVVGPDGVPLVYHLPEPFEMWDAKSIRDKINTSAESFAQRRVDEALERVVGVVVGKCSSCGGSGYQTHEEGGCDSDTLCAPKED